MSNLSKIRRDKMIEFLEMLKEQHSDDESLIAINQIEKELVSKRYGLVWEEHEEAVDVMMRENIPVFEEVQEREITTCSDASYNFLLEGDNLHSLYLLEKTHREKIDVIYIDPPYNTGSRDFKYNDSFVDKQDGYRHSKWISFMDKRLRIAKKLLSKVGVIFISIDDNEEAPLKLLCDEVFGEECFVANVSWQRTYSPRNDSKGLSSEVEHILIYSNRVNWMPKKLQRTEKMNSIYKSPDNDPKPWTSSSVTAPSASTHQGMVYAIQHPFTGELMYPTNGRCWALNQEQMLENLNEWAKYRLVQLNDDKKRAEICGVTVEEIRKGVMGIVLEQELEEAQVQARKVLERGNWPYFYFTNNGKGGMRRKTYLEEMDGRMPTNYWPFSEVGHTDGAKKELKNIFGGTIPFDTPKPTSLVERILDIASTNESIILDFFAGSGTTAHAVMKYNAKHEDSHRKYILCTNNENNICENVTYRRIQNVITGYAKEEAILSNLKYYRTNSVSQNDEYLADALLKHVGEMIQLEHGIKLDNKSYIMIMNDEEADELEQKWSQYTDIKAIYVAQDVLLTASQEALFATADVHIIPDYYFNFELREAGELW